MRRDGGDGSVIQYHNLNPLCPLLLSFISSVPFARRVFSLVLSVGRFTSGRIPFVVGYFFDLEWDAILISAMM